MIRTDWKVEEIKEIYELPLLELVYQASSVHRKHHDPSKIKISQLISFKTGACTEDCAYCAQSSRYKTHVVPHKSLSVQEVIQEALEAKKAGVERVCLSASWRNIPQNEEFEKVLEMISQIKKQGLSVCCTMGMMNSQQAKRLVEAGIIAYNHNLDTSNEYYPQIISTRSYKERLETINRLTEAGAQFCSGGIIGLGESENDRIAMIHQLATLKKHPYTVPLNLLVPVKGTPLENNPLLPAKFMIRMIATVRMVMPASMICLAAGRKQMNDEAQALCFLAGANSIFVGTKLLTTPNPEMDDDTILLNELGLKMY